MKNSLAGHCEAISAEAISFFHRFEERDCFASLAMNCVKKQGQSCSCVERQYVGLR
jgi:hypothetical protein